MKKFIMLGLIIFSLTGCSLIPRMTFDSKGTTPQATQKSKMKDVCKGEAVFNDNGDMISCTRGYMSYAENYSKKERKYTFKEKILNFFRNLTGSIFWIAIALVIFLPGTFGLIIGRIVEGTIGIGAKSLKAVVTAVQRARTQGKDLTEALDAEEDADVKKYIRKLKENKGIK